MLSCTPMDAKRTTAVKHSAKCRSYSAKLDAVVAYLNTNEPIVS
jgi:hypothetical protein